MVALRERHAVLARHCIPNPAQQPSSTRLRRNAAAPLVFLFDS
jgi:hypothetical protein